MDKYKDMREFISKHFFTTTSKYDRLHTEEIIDILHKKGGFLYDTINTAKVFKSMGIGEHKVCCRINGKTKSGYYYISYKEV